MTEKTKEKERYCNICYENISACGNCNVKLGNSGWCSEDGKHYCNQDCQPEIFEAMFIKVNKKLNHPRKLRQTNK